MKRLVNLRTAAWTLSIILGLAGCESKPGNPTGTETPSKDAAAQASDSTEATTSKFQDVLAKLTPEDVSKATAQKICPVSEEPLGSMGVPPKVDVNGQAVWICCESCREKLLADPDKHLAKIKTE